MSTFATDGTLGVDLSAVNSSPAFDSGQTVSLDDGGCAIYVKAVSAIPQFNFVSINTSGASADRVVQGHNLTTTRAASQPRIAVAQTSIAAGQYGWVHTKGSGLRGKVATGCQPNVRLYSTATEGVLDDAVVSAGLISGLVAITSAASASAPGVFAPVELFVGHE